MRPFRCVSCGAEVFATTESGLPGLLVTFLVLFHVAEDSGLESTR